MRLGIVASERPYAEHVLPIWEALHPNERAVCAESGAEPLTGYAASTWLAAAPRDLRSVYRWSKAPAAFMDHGTGLQWYGQAGRAAIGRAALIMAPNEFMAERYRDAFPKSEIVVIGTPKMDELATIGKHGGPPTLAVSFHWTGMRLSPAPMMRFEAELFDLAASDEIQLLGHAHPRIWPEARRWYLERGIEPVETFAEVVARADVYACDHSSTIYEWAALGRPAILLDVGETGVLRSTGLRYTTFADVGWHVTPGDLADVFAIALEFGPPEGAANVADFYPYIGESTDRALAALRGLDAA